MTLKIIGSPHPPLASRKISMSRGARNSKQRPPERESRTRRHESTRRRQPGAPTTVKRSVAVLSLLFVSWITFVLLVSRSADAKSQSSASVWILLALLVLFLPLWIGLLLRRRIPAKRIARNNLWLLIALAFFTVTGLIGLGALASPVLLFAGALFGIVWYVGPTNRAR